MLQQARLLSVVPRFPTQKGRTDGSAWGGTRGQQRKAGRPSTPRPLEPALWLPGRERPHISGGLEAETRTFPSAQVIPDQTVTSGATQRQGKVRPSHPRANSLPPLPRGLRTPGDTDRPTQRPLHGPEEQLRHSPGPHYHRAPFCREVGVTKVRGCKSMQTPLRCH